MEEILSFIDRDACDVGMLDVVDGSMRFGAVKTYST